MWTLKWKYIISLDCVRNDLGKGIVGKRGLLGIIRLTVSSVTVSKLNGPENKRQAAASRRRSGAAPWVRHR